MDTSWFFRASPIDQRVSSFHRELLQEVQKTGDNAKDVLDVLEKHGFDHLSQETQLYVLCQSSPAPAWLSVYKKVIRANKINTMIALLQRTPLFAIAKDSIPYHKWIESPTWMQNILYENKLRWKPGRCKCRNHSDPCNDAEKLCALTKIAFTMFAADLLSTGLGNEHCFLYLLNEAPDLLKIRVPRHCNTTPVRWVIRKLIHNPDILDILMMKESYGENTGEILTFLLQAIYNYPNSESHFIENRRFLIITVARGHEEKIRQYRDFSGSSLLHIVCQHMRDPSLLYWINELLRIGLDPSERNKKNRTALDVIITSFCQESGSVIIQHDKNIDESQFLARSFCQAVNMFVPYFKPDTSVSQIKIPKLHNARYPSVESINDDLINMYCKILDKGVFPSCTETNLFRVHMAVNIHGCTRKNSTCKLCKPLVDIMWQVLHKGLDLSDNVAMFECGKTLTLTGDYVRMFEQFRSWMPCRCNTTDTAVHLTKCGCCGWQLLELMIHCNPYSTGHTKCISRNGCDFCYNTNESLMHVLSKKNYRCPLTLFDISGITKLIWMYFPADKIPITEYLHKLYDDISATDEIKVVRNLQDMIQTVRPLMLLCRLCILQHVQWKDIKHLPAPVGLIRYIELGDISTDHIIHEVV